MQLSLQAALMNVRNLDRSIEFYVGPRVLMLEADRPDQLDVIEQRLTERNAFVGRRRTDTWEAVVGVDPDRIEVSVSSSLTGVPIQSTGLGPPRPDGLRGRRVTQTQDHLTSDGAPARVRSPAAGGNQR